MRILTGLQPSGRLHIGNYFGAIKPAVTLQNEGEAFYFIADYHAMTSSQNPKALRQSVHDLAIDFLSCGLDPEKAVFFRQSAIPEVHELAWILSTLCPMGLLERCHSFKDKVAKGLSATHALFAYPALMAADILLYDSDLVPVGDDQKQHLEVTRDLAAKVNDCYGEGTLIMPKARIHQHTAKVPGTDGQKMSKSYNNTIPIFGEEKTLRKTIMRILTDSTPVEEPKPTADSVLLPIYRLFVDDSTYQEMLISHQKGGEGYGHYKKQVFEAYWEFFRPMRDKRQEIETEKTFVDHVLQEGSQRARQEADRVLTRIRSAVGIS